MSIDDLFRQISSGGAKSTGKPEYIVAGLGNPGREYEETRHNAGFLAIDYVAEKLGVKINRAKYNALCAEVRIGEKNVLLMKPQTYMNLSGTSICEAAAFYKIPTANILVLCDDITQDPGKLRIRKSGSAGGHNGLKNIIQYGGSDKFPRIRIGVGAKPTPEYDLADWVTGKFSAEDKKAIGARFADVEKAIPIILSGDIERAMCLYNG
jgi:PTH1 family peptidyl-tRNA hydrolase